MESNALITGYYVEKEKVNKLDKLENPAAKKEGSFYWYHLDVLNEQAVEWLKNKIWNQYWRNAWYRQQFCFLDFFINNAAYYCC